MTKDQAIKILKKLQDDRFDQEQNHIVADRILCKLLTQLGYKDVVIEWEKINKWYA